MINLENLGYKDITKDKPIHFIECLGEFLESVYPFNKRFYKKEEDIITVLKVGDISNQIYISGICIFSNKGWQKFEINTIPEYMEEHLNKTISNAIKYWLKENNKL